MAKRARYRARNAGPTGAGRLGGAEDKVSTALGFYWLDASRSQQWKIVAGAERAMTAFKISIDSQQCVFTDRLTVAGEAKETGGRSSSNHNNNGVELAQQHNTSTKKQSRSLTSRSAESEKRQGLREPRQHLSRDAHRPRISNTMMRSSDFAKAIEIAPQGSVLDTRNAGRRWSCKSNIPTH